MSVVEYVRLHPDEIDRDIEENESAVGTTR